MMSINAQARISLAGLSLESLEKRELLTATAVQLLPDSYQTWGLEQYAHSGDVAYLSLETDAEGIELWRTDGTEAGTEIVIDLVGGEESGFPHSPVAVGDKLFFFARNESKTYLWGTPDGKNPAPLSPVEYYESGPLPMGDGIVFIDTETTRVWTSDGTVEGTQAISEPLFEGTASYNVWLFSHGEKLYVHTPTEALVLNSDGESLGSLNNIYVTNYTEVEFKSFGDQLWAFATSGETSQLWKINTESDETSLVHHWPDTTISWNDVSLVGDELFFTASAVYDTAFGPRTKIETYNRQLWKTNVNSGETVRLPLSETEMVISTLEISGDLVYVQLAGDGSYDLWRLSNGTGTPEHLHAFERIVPQAENPLLKVGSAIYFFDGADLPLEQQTLYRYQPGTGTQAVRSFDAGIVGDLKLFKDELLFTADDGSGLALWASDGTLPGTRSVHKIDVTPSTTLVRPIGTANGRLLFGDDHRIGAGRVWSRDKSGFSQAIADSFALIAVEPSFPGDPMAWATDGTRENTKIQDPPEFELDLVLTSLDGARIGDTMYHSSLTPSQGNELYASGNHRWHSRSQVVKDILPGPLSSDPLHLTAIGDILYFSANDIAVGNGTGTASNREPWRSDGTEAGTYKLLEINTSVEESPNSTSSSHPQDFVPSSRGLVFSAIPDGKLVAGKQTTLRSWYSSDGTEEGTFRLDALDGMQLLAEIDRKVYLTNDQGLWQTDGTEAGTTRIRAFAEESVLSPLGIGGSSTQAYFVITDSRGPSLWQTDGTVDGTRKVQSFSTNSEIREILVAEDKTFFHLEHPNGDSIWHATDDGVELVKAFVGNTIQKEDYYESISRLPIFRTLYFIGETEDFYVDTGSDLFFYGGPNGNNEKWVTDGSTDGTFEIRETQRQVYNWTLHENLAYFNMQDPNSDKYETWVTDGTPGGTEVYDLFAASLDYVSWNGEVYFTSVEVENSPATTTVWKFGDPKITGDIDDDGRVGFDDFLELSANFGRTSADETHGDLNDDQIVDFEDFRMLAANFGETIEDLVTIEPIPNRSTAAAEALFASFMEEEEEEV